MAFALQYPPSWRVTGSPTIGPVNFQSGVSGIDVRILPMRAAATIKQTVKQVTRSDITYARVHWVRTTLGRQPAMVGVDSPPTEGGVPLSDGIYITSWRGRVYVVIFTAYHKPAITRLGQFPAVYGQIFRTWRFL
ncbi:MAG: hypothetical protein NVS2B16_01210 [Chloroflexota bacterium]